MRIDVRGVDRVEGVRAATIETELERIDHELAPGDIVLVWTGIDLRQPGYENRHAGLRREATAFLVEHGVRMIGIDAWTVDRAVDVMVSEAKAGTLEQAFESHLYGREREYLQIERLAPRSAPAANRLHGRRVSVQARGRKRKLDAGGRDRRGARLGGEARDEGGRVDPLDELAVIGEPGEIRSGIAGRGQVGVRPVGAEEDVFDRRHLERRRERRGVVAAEPGVVVGGSAGRSGRPSGAAAASSGSRSASEASRCATNGAVPPRCASWIRMPGQR